MTGSVIGEAFCLVISQSPKNLSVIYDKGSVIGEVQVY